MILYSKNWVVISTIQYSENKRKMSASHEKSPNRAAPQQQQSALFDLWFGRQFVQTWPVGRGTFEPKLHLETDGPWRIYRRMQISEITTVIIKTFTWKASSIKITLFKWWPEKLCCKIKVRDVMVLCLFWSNDQAHLIQNGDILLKWTLQTYSCFPASFQAKKKNTSKKTTKIVATLYIPFKKQTMLKTRPLNWLGMAGYIYFSFYFLSKNRLNLCFPPWRLSFGSPRLRNKAWSPTGFCT